MSDIDIVGRTRYEAYRVVANDGNPDDCHDMSDTANTLSEAAAEIESLRTQLAAVQAELAEARKVIEKLPKIEKWQHVASGMRQATELVRGLAAAIPDGSVVDVDKVIDDISLAVLAAADLLDDMARTATREADLASQSPSTEAATPAEGEK